MRKLLCSSDTCAPPIAIPFNPAASISRAAWSSGGLRNTEPAFGSCSGWLAMRFSSSSRMHPREAAPSPAGSRNQAAANTSSLAAFLGTPELSAYWLKFVTAVPANIARALIGGLKHDFIADAGAIRELIPRLEADGLIRTVPQRGMQVAQVDVRLIRDARKKELKPFLAQQPATTGSINTPMQCCLKGVCSQCLQWQIDPQTGKRTKAVFSCSWQDQPLDIVDLDNLDQRLSQNRVQEHLTSQWLDYLLTQHKVARV